MKERNINLDLIRCVAAIFVISVHFCLNSEFYELTCSGMRMLIMCILRTAFITCVPLFLMLTGYLMNKKELTISYYKGIKRTYCIYVLVCICCLLFNVIYEKENMGIKKMILSILDFSADSYAWYIEMYIGLFLIIPFLNILWNNLNDVGRKWLIITLLGLTALPSLLNCWDLLSLGDKTRVYSAIVPDYWETLYPITYYFLGAYLKEETKKIFLLKESIILLGLMIVFGLFNYYRSYDGTYEWIGYNSFWGVQAIIISVLIFRVLMAAPMAKTPNIVKKGILKISELSLGIYLASVISDKIIYPLMAEMVTDTVRRIDMFPIIVFSSFVIALIFAILVNIVYIFLAKAVQGLVNFSKKMLPIRPNVR